MSSTKKGDDKKVFSMKEIRDIKHELKNQIGVVMGNIQLMEEQNENTEICIRTLRAMTKYIDDITPK